MALQLLRLSYIGLSAFTTIEVKLLHPQKALSPIFVMFLEILSSVIFAHIFVSSKAYGLIAITLSSNDSISSVSSIPFNLYTTLLMRTIPSGWLSYQDVPSNTSPPTYVTLSGISIVDNCGQLRKALSPIVVKVFGSVIDMSGYGMNL